jgi:hypothetical protein
VSPPGESGRSYPHLRLRGGPWSGSLSTFRATDRASRDRVGEVQESVDSEGMSDAGKRSNIPPWRRDFRQLSRFALGGKDWRMGVGDDPDQGGCISGRCSRRIHAR